MFSCGHPGDSDLLIANNHAHEPGKGNLEQKQVSPTLHTP